MNRKPYKLAIISTHPIQYQAPWFRAMAADPRFDLHVFFGHRASAADQGDAGFGVKFEWDLSLLDGYPHTFLRNVARKPALHAFNGIDVPEIGDIIRSSRFDSVMINGWNYKGAWQTMWACWRTGTPVMVRSDSHLHTPRSTWKSVVKGLPYRVFLSKITACLAVGSWSRNYYLHYGVKPDRILTVPHVVDEAWFQNQAAQLMPSRALLRARWGLREKQFVFLFVGKFTNKKRPLHFIRALQLAGESERSVAGLMVGDGPLREKCEELAKQGDVPVVFAGFLNQSQIAKAYVAGDMLVLPSDGGETWGLVVNEAMWCGRPCMVSDRVGCGPDLVRPGETGEVFPLDNVPVLAQTMSRLASSPKAVRKMGEKALQKMPSFSIQVAVDQMAEALRALEQLKS
jgi:glycosyltransferase involved in cell wall biosynthesis